MFKSVAEYWLKRMSEFLLDVYSEEIPSSAQLLAKYEMRKSFEDFLKKENINFSLIEIFSTPRRITVIINGIKKNVNKLVKEIRGPSTSADQKAIEGFIKSQGISNRKFLSKKTINEKEYFFFQKKNKIKKFT